VLAATEAGAQTVAAPAEFERARRRCRRYLALVQPPEQMEAMISATAAPGGDPRGTEMQHDAQETMRDVLPRAREEMAKAHARIYTEAELEALVTFYESAAGRSIVRKSPQLASAMHAVIRPLLDESRARRCKADPDGYMCRPAPREPALMGDARSTGAAGGAQGAF
jgi:hypothetical protein